MLDKHAPLISALKAGRIKVIKDKPLNSAAQGNTAFFDVQGGFVEVLDNKVTVLVEGAVETES